MHYQDRNVDHRQIIVKLGLGQNSDAFELRLDASHHSLSPPILSNSFGYRRARPVESVEWHRDVFVELGSMICGAVADAIDDFLRNAVGVPLRHHEGRRDRADEDLLCHTALTVPGDIARRLDAARGVTDVDDILEIKLFDNLISIIRV